MIDLDLIRPTIRDRAWTLVARATIGAMRWLDRRRR